jgi:hypothetical protein
LILRLLKKIPLDYSLLPYFHLQEAFARRNNTFIRSQRSRCRDSFKSCPMDNFHETNIEYSSLCLKLDSTPDFEREKKVAHKIDGQSRFVQNV